MKILFVCSRNQWRSPTAEQVYRNDSRIEVRSAGTSDQARKTISNRDINWADLILVMEDAHKKRLRQQFRETTSQKQIVVLDIPDDFEYMDSTLIQMIKDSVEPILANYFSD